MMLLEVLRIFAGAEAVLGLLFVALAVALFQVETLFKLQLIVFFTAGGWVILSAFILLFAGRKPSYRCVRINFSFHLPNVILMVVAFSTMVTYIPYEEEQHCTFTKCQSVSPETRVLVNSVLIVLLTSMVVEIVLSLVISVICLCSIVRDAPQQSEELDRLANIIAQRINSQNTELSRT